MRRVGVIASLLVSATALGHGLPPMTNGVYFATDDPNSLYVATTFGLLVSHDSGCTFYWVCEAKIGYGDPYEPHYAVTHDGTIFATSFNGLRVSRDGACSFDTAVAGTYVDAVAIAPNGDVWAATGQGSGDDVLVSTDNGMTFASSGIASPNIRWTGLVSAAGRIYAAGEDSTPAVHLARHDATGWTQLPLTGIELDPHPRVAVVAADPDNPDVVYVVSSLSNGDHLYRSTDGGMTFAQSFATPIGWIHDVVIHGGTTYATTMVPAGSIAIGGPAYASTDGGVSFTPMVGAPQLQCLGVAPDGALVGCGTNWEPDFKAVARSTDGITWTKVWRIVELAGALACPNETSCEQSWDTVQQMFGTTGPACGPNVVDAGTTELEPPPLSGGCCDATAPANGVWAIAIAGLFRRRRRGQCAHADDVAAVKLRAPPR